MGRPADDQYYDNRDYDYNRGHRREPYPDRRHPRDDHYDRPPRREPPRGRPPAKRKKNAWGYVSVVVRVLIIVLLLMFFTLPEFKDQRVLFIAYLQEGLYHYNDIPDYMIFNIERDMSMQTGADTAVSEFTLTVEKPFELKDEKDFTIQELEDIRSESTGGALVNITEGDAKILFMGSIGLGGQANMRVTYKIRSAHIVWNLASADTGNIGDIPADIKAQYTKNDWQVNEIGTKDPMINPYNPSLGTNFYRIHPTDPDIKELAMKIKGNEENVYRILRDFFNFLDRGDGNSSYSGGAECRYPDQVEMQKSRETWGGLPKPARATLDDWLGDCDDQSFLFISMCRAVGIPARVTAGALWDNGVGAWGGHGWAQVYVPVKDGNDAWVTIDIVNNLFFERDPYRFQDYVGSGIPGELQEYYTSWTYHSNGGSNLYIDEIYTDVGHKAIPGETIVHV